MKYFLSALLATSILATSASALTTVNESAAGTGAFPTGGDYADMSGASTNMLGNVPLGATQIVGDLRGTQGDFADWVFFTITAGTEVTAASITTTAATGFLGILVLDSVGVEVLTEVPFSAGGTQTVIGAGDLPLGAGSYNFGLFFTAGTASEDVDYTISTTVSAVSSPAPVPLPAGLPLLAAALGAFGLIRHRART